MRCDYIPSEITVQLTIEGEEIVKRTPAQQRCCGVWISLDGFTNSCHKCGQLYNTAGQRLVDPSLWGEETGEHPADILRIK